MSESSPTPEEVAAARALIAQADADARAAIRARAQAAIDAMDALAARLLPAVAEARAALEAARAAVPTDQLAPFFSQDQSLALLGQLPREIRDHQVFVLNTNQEPAA